MTSEDINNIRKAFRILLKNGKGSQEAYSFLIGLIEKNIKFILRRKNLTSIKTNDYYEDTVSQVMENLITFANKNPDYWKSIKNPDDYIFMVCRNVVNNWDKTFMNREYLNFKRVFSGIIKKLENTEKLHSLNGRIGIAPALPVFSDYDEIVSALSQLDFKQIKDIDTEIWTPQKKDLLGKLMVSFFESTRKSAAKEDLFRAISASLGIKILKEDTPVPESESELQQDYEDSLFSNTAVSKVANVLNPEEMATYSELVDNTEKILRAGLKELSENERKVLMLYFSGKHNLREISELMGFKRAQNVDYYVNKGGLAGAFTKIQKLFTDFLPKGMSVGELLALFETDIKEIFNKLVSEYGYNEN